MRCKPKVLDTKHRPICFHFLPAFKLEFLSLLSWFLPRRFPPPSSFSSPPSLLVFVSHPIPSVFPYDGELQKIGTSSSLALFICGRAEADDAKRFKIRMAFLRAPCCYYYYYYYS